MQTESFEKWLAAPHPDAPPDASAPIGEIIGGWEVVALLDRGGSAAVYRVRRAPGGACAALKLAHSADERTRTRFASERELLLAQTQTCFARLVDSGDWRGHPYLVMEELEPIELPRGEREVAAFILAVCQAVAALHAQGLVHRDLKPGNIMRRKDGSPVLIDLGLAKQLKSGDAPRPPLDSLSVADGRKIAVGTPGFSAPEQFLSGAADESSDVHGIGMLIYTCFGGNPPGRWKRVVEKATTSIPAQRFKSVRDLTSGIKAASPVKSAPVWATLAAAYLPLAALVLWTVARSFYAHRRYGADSSQICYFIGQMLAIGGFESIIPVGLTFRQPWARGLAIAAGGVFAFYLAASPWLENGVQTLNGYALVAVLLGFCPYIPAAVLLLVPRVARWFGRG